MTSLTQARDRCHNSQKFTVVSLPKHKRHTHDRIIRSSYGMDRGAGFTESKRAVLGVISLGLVDWVPQFLTGPGLLGPGSLLTSCTLSSRFPRRSL